MKKIIVLLSLMLMAAVTAHAAYKAGDGAGNVTWAATGVGQGVTVTVKVSANVYGEYIAPSGAAAGIGYSFGTAHSSGTKSYASSALDNRLYMKENSLKNAALTDGYSGTDVAHPPTPDAASRIVAMSFCEPRS